MTRRMSPTRREPYDHEAMIARCLELIRDGVKQREIVTILGASKSAVSRWCQEAVRRSQNLNDQRLVNTTKASLSQMLWARIEVNGRDDCWPWVGFVKPNGYGSLNYKGTTHQAHRAVYQCLVGDIPDRLVIDHKCKNTLCCNPRHLQCVTQSENLYLARVRA